MAYASITKPSLHFNTKLYTGNGSAQSHTGVGFRPDLTWIKPRSFADNHVLFDVARGVTGRLIPNDNSVQGTVSNMVTSFDSDGFSLGNNDNVARNSATFATWNWKANGAGSANTDGSINSTVSLNSASGFSIVSYTGTQNAGTVGHGLGVVPSMIIVKSLASADAWYVWMKGFSGTQAIFLDSNAAQGSHASYWNSTTPTSSVYSVLNNTGTNNSGGMIAYCFAEKKGFSKFGSYIGNGSTDGTFIYTGFKPAFVILKIKGHAGSWLMFDNKRDGLNPNSHRVYANGSDAEDTGSGSQIDFLSNGFKGRSSDSSTNTINNKYLYMAFAEEPLVANVGASIPATAR